MKRTLSIVTLRSAVRAALAVGLGASVFASAVQAVPIAGNLVIQFDAALGVTSGGGPGPGGQPLVSQWNDQAALGGLTHATQGSVGRQPEYYTSVASLNGQSAVRFAGTFEGAGNTDELSITSAGSGFTSAASLFVVARPEAHAGGGDTNFYTIYDTGTHDSWWRFGASGYHATFRSPRYEAIMPPAGGPTSGSHVFEIVSETVGSNYEYLENGTLLGSSSDAGRAFAAGTTHKIGNAVSSVDAKAFEGYVAEVLAYNIGLNDAERWITTNYLSAKYNLTISNDRYAGDNPGNSNYDRDVFGIGRHTSGDTVTTLANSGLAVTESGGTLGANEWVLAGHKTAVNSINPDGSWARVWYVDKTETTGIDANLTFDYSDGGLVAPSLGTGPWSFINLLYSPTDPFSFNSLGIAGTISGDSVSFLVPNAQLLDGYYTLQALTIPEPSTFALLGLSIVGLAVKARRRRSVA